MTISPRLLLETSIAQLQTLAAFLSEEMSEYRQRTIVASSPETRACKEILLTISVLIPKLQAARHVVGEGLQVNESRTDHRINGGGHCASCEDN